MANSTIVACQGGTAGAAEEDVVVDADVRPPAPAVGDRLRRFGIGGMSEEDEAKARMKMKVRTRKPPPQKLAVFPFSVEFVGVAAVVEHDPANDRGRVGRRMSG